MIGVYLRPDNFTQVVRGRVRKKSVLEIQESYILPKSYVWAWDITDPVGVLVILFRDIRKQFGGRQEEIYLVLPDYLFSMIDCFRYETDADIEDRIKQWTQRELSEVCYSQPITTSPEPQQRYATVAVLDRSIADALAEAADKEKMQLVSVEPASISFLRCTGVFNKEELVLHSFAGEATFIGYSSNGGLFKMDVPELSIQHLGNLPKEEAETQIRQSMIAFENTAHQTFEFLNQDLPYTILAEPDVISDFEPFKVRKAEPHYFPDFIECNILRDDEQEEWMCVAGTLAQDIDFSDDQFVEVLDGYETISSGNVLPEDIQQKAKSFQRMENLVKYSRLGIICLLIAAILEIVGIFFLQSVQIPPGLEEYYQAAQDTMESINAELELIRVEEKEHEYPIEAYTEAVRNLPQGVNFISFEVGNPSKKEDSQWVKLKIVAVDPLKFQDYVARLSQSSIFSGVTMPEFSTDNSTSYKTAQIVMGKGEMNP